MKSVILATCATLALAMPALAQGLIEPGAAVGPVRAGVTEADLRAQMPSDQVERVIWHLGEGIGRCATKLYAGTPNAIYVLWEDSPEYDLSTADPEGDCKAELDRKLAMQVNILVSDGGAGAWKTAEGITVGMSVADLSKTLGGPVTILACPCDFGGYVRDEADVIEHMIDFWVDFPPGTDEMLADVVNAELDYELSSNDIPAAMAGDFTIRRIAVGLGQAQ